MVNCGSLLSISQSKCPKQHLHKLTKGENIQGVWSWGGLVPISIVGESYIVIQVSDDILRQKEKKGEEAGKDWNQRCYTHV